MSSTKRRPIAHTARTQFTPYAVEIYEEMGRLMCRCGPPRPGLTSPEEYCNACERWYDLHTELNRELQCRPWQWPCVGRQGPKHAGSMCMNAEIAERMRLLREGVKQMRAQRRAAAQVAKQALEDAARVVKEQP